MLGGLEVVIAGSAVVVARAKVGALLAMLALQPNTVLSADRLIDGLWGESVPAGATATLHSYISMLRRLVETNVETNAETSAETNAEPDVGSPARRVVHRKPGYLLAIDPDSVDALRFESLMAEGAAAAASLDHRGAATHLRGALGLWRGAALVDLAFASFAGPEIARLDELRLSAYETCIESELALGLHHRLVPELDALVSANPLRERLRAQQMLALYRCDRQADALRAFGELRRTLAEDLGLEPSQALRHLEDQILRQSAEIDLRPDESEGLATRTIPAAAESRPPTAPPGSPGSPGLVSFPSNLAAPAWPTVGRSDELTWLHRRAAESAAGTRGIELIVGAAGIGKSHLAATFARDRSRDGTIVLFGRCSETPGLLYAPFTEALRSALGDVDGNQLRELLGDQACDLALLLPELTQRFPLGPSQPTQNGHLEGAIASDVRRHLLFDAVAQLLERLAVMAPVVLIIDDLHWADDSTITLVEHLVRRPRPSRLLVVATLRPSWTAEDPLGRAVHALDRDGRLHATRLTGLSETDVSALIHGQGERISAEPVVTPVVKMLTARTDGNPFFVLEILRHLDGASISAESAVLPPRVRELIQQRLAAIEPGSRHILEIAAVIGKQFDIDLCQAADPRRSDERVVLGALDEAVKADLILEVPKTFGRYEFAQDLVLDAILAGLSNTARRMAHRDVARALEAQPSTNPARVSAMARHWLGAGAGGDLAKAVRYASEAARHAEKLAAWSEAARWYQLAIDALADAPIIDPAAASRSRGQLLVALHTAIWCATDGVADPALIAEAMDIGRTLDDGVLFTDAVLASMLTTARTETVHHVEVLEEALARLDKAPREPDPTSSRHRDGARVRIQSVMSEALAFADRGDEAVAVARDALLAARTLDDPTLLAQVMDQLVAELPPWASDERRALVAELADADRHGDPVLSMRIHHLDALVALEIGEIDRFEHSTVAHLALADRIGKQRSRAGATQKHALVSLLRGRLDEASTRSREVLAISQHPNFQQGQLCQIALIDRERDALADSVSLARSLIADAADVVETTGRLGRQLSIAATAGIVLLDQGDRAAVRAAIDVCTSARLATTTTNFTYTFGVAALAELVAHEGTDQEVSDLLPLVAACIGRHASMLGIVTLGSVDRVHAMLLARRGDDDRARHAFERAIADHDHGGSVVLRARIRVDAARWLEARPASGATDGLDSRRLLDEAEPLIELHRLTRLRRELEGMRNSARSNIPPA